MYFSFFLLKFCGSVNVHVYVCVVGGGDGVDDAVTISVAAAVVFNSFVFHTAKAQTANTHLNIKNELLVHKHTHTQKTRRRKQKIAVQQVAVSSFHTISINFSLSLLYKYHFYFFFIFAPFSVDISEPWSEPHAFVTWIEYDEMNEPTSQTVICLANEIAFSCSTILCG